MAPIDVKEFIRNEYKKCALNPQYFIRKYCYIQEPVRGRILFDLYKYQEEAIDKFQDFQFNIILKGRQIGISTAAAAYALWMMLFHKDKNVLVIATKQDTAKNLIAKVRFAFELLPVWLQSPCIENNKLSLKFNNGSNIKATTAAGDAGRSEALSLLIVDEAAFIKNIDEIWTAALPTLSTGGKAILISTPNGMGNFFHRTYMAAIEQREEEMGDTKFFWNPIKLDWRVHPERDENWRAQMGKIQGEMKARQEFDAEFIGSGNTVIDVEVIEMFKLMVKEPPTKAGFDKNLWIWEEPNYNRAYMVVADVARGDGTDFSAFHVIDLERCLQVAEYKGKIDTANYGHFLVEVATKYNDALLVIERENVGWSVIQKVIDRNYKNLFYMSKDRKVVEVERNVTSRYYREEKQLIAGFGTTISTRPVIINKLDMYMRDRFNADDGLEIRSQRFIHELETFIWDNGKPQATEGCNDDLVMAMAIGLWVRDTALKLQQEGVKITRHALDGFRRSEIDPIYTNNHLPYDPYKMPLTHDGDSEDMRWLLG